MRRTIIWTLALTVCAVLSYRLVLQAGSDDSAASGLHFTGDVALWTVAIKPDKTGDYEKVLMRVRDALQKSDDPQRKQQAAGWRVMKLSEPLPDGNVAYVHLITPVVAGADYTLLKPIYDAFPSESQDLYALYRGAFAKNLALATGTFVVDMSKTEPQSTPPQSTQSRVPQQP